MEPVKTGWSIGGSHDECKQLLTAGELPRWGARYLNILFPLNDSRMMLLVFCLINVGVVPNTLLLTTSVLAGCSGETFFQGRPQPYPERVFLLCKLVYEIASFAPEGEIGFTSTGVGGAAGWLFLVRRINKRCRVRVVRSGGGGESMEGYIGWPPGARVEGRNLEDSGLEGAAPTPYVQKCGSAGRRVKSV